MKRTFIDTNIVIDLLAKREPFYIAASELFSRADKGEFKLIISSLTIANTNYILSKQKSAKQAKSILKKFRGLVEISSLSSKIIDFSLNDEGIPDFEDSLQYFSALDSNCQIIVTRNGKDYKKSLLPVMTPIEYLKSIRKK